MQYVTGQRWASETQPELGLGVVVRADGGRVSVAFPAAEETLTYAAGSAPLRRVTFEVGDAIKLGDGSSATVESVRDEGGLLYYRAQGEEIAESVLDDQPDINRPDARLFGGDVDAGRLFDLRYRAHRALATLRKRRTRGLIGGRVDLIPHQLYIASTVAQRYAPRVLLADEVGLGKTIEACMILHRLLLTGRAARVLVLVPESLVHQWFVELLRRFQLQFAIYDEDRCRAIEGAPEAGNPFLDEQWVLASTDWMTHAEVRIDQAAEAGWDMVIVDEAHHLEWTRESVSDEYAAVERLARVSPGLLLLTATPEQLGRAGHFARLRLLDPDRYDNLDAYLEERTRYTEISSLASRLIDGSDLTEAEASRLKELIGGEISPEEGLRKLLDLHGTGRVMFRNLRRNLGGFPERKVSIHSLDAPGEGGEFSVDARMKWLAGFLKAEPDRKVLLICRSRELAEAIEEALREHVQVKAAVFHEGLTLIQRDRNAAWFAEEDGARILICSEIGSEGRNFQFAHHLVLFDLPEEPGLLEQRIGRLDRIGQTETIRIHVLAHRGSRTEWLAKWYDEGLDAFETCLHGGSAVMRAFGGRLDAIDDALIEETCAFKKELDVRLEEGRDRLLELSSLDKEKAEKLATRVGEIDAEEELEALMLELLDHFGVAVEALSEGRYFLRPDSLFSAEALPGLNPEGQTVTFRRAEALAREDFGFLTWDHPMVEGALEAFAHAGQGNCAFVQIEGDEPGIIVECVYILEVVAPSKLHADRFLTTSTIRVAMDHQGRHLREAIEEGAVDGDPSWLRAKAETLKKLVPPILDKARERAERRARRMREEATERVDTLIGAEIERLQQLKRLGHPVRDEEIEAAEKEIEALHHCIGDARVKMDAVRVVVAG